jgi:hypothetical protein
VDWWGEQRRARAARDEADQLAAGLPPGVDPDPARVRDCGDARRDWPLGVVPDREPERCDNRRPLRYLGHPADVGGVRAGWSR